MRFNLFMIALSVISFIASAVSFCVAIGANFTNEGWGDSKAGLADADKSLLIVSAILIAIAIVIFWIGMHRLSKPVANDTSE